MRGLDEGLSLVTTPQTSNFGTLCSMYFQVYLCASHATSGLNLNVLSVWFRFGEALNPNRTKRTIRVGSGSGSEIFPNRTEPNCSNTNSGVKIISQI